MKQVQSILKALDGLELKKDMAASTYGAQSKDHIFDLEEVIKAISSKTD